MIEGVSVHPLKRLPDERGSVMHMLRATDAHFERFGEVYFSTVNPGQVKAWHRHSRKTVNLAVPYGQLRLVAWREGEPQAMASELDLSPENYLLVTIRPGIWYGFQCLGTETALLANCATEPYEADEGETLPENSATIPYAWQPSHA